MEATNVVSIRTGKVWLDEEAGIVRVQHAHGMAVGLEDAKEQIAAILKVSKGRRRPLLVDLRGLRGTDHAARDYFGGEESKAAWIASVLLTGPPISSAIGHLWIAAHNSDENPGKQFTSEAEAVAWLRGFIE